MSSRELMVDLGSQEFGRLCRDSLSVWQGEGLRDELVSRKS